MIKCSQSSKLSSMGIWSYIHFTKAFKSKENFILLSCIFCLNLFGCWVRRLKVTKPFIYVIYGLAAVSARWFFWGSEGMLAQKLVTLTSTIFLIYWMDILPTQGICEEASLATGLHTNYPCQFCHTDFINQEEFIKHMEICSVIDSEGNLSLLPANHLNIWQNWEAQWNSHHEVDSEVQQQWRVNWSHEHLFMNRLWTSSA